ncbi:extracellular solute-binding protein [Actinomadura darangshiensis]|uniref:Extracellular solute-binding protein n=1 Tax=Actinomadura darangshiensis TaxID=705336 RepID=A0A4R5BTZ9_9ACTN|nr:extracellular solute-binding protein [Actinomadura darangshiensis]TDD87644.1 extracellular solute-binding protein [Actinomadura darangshiensis]
MARMIRIGAALGAALLGITACSGGGAGDAGPPASEGGQLTVSNWQWLEPGRGDKLWSVVEGYSKTNPKATLKKVSVTRADYEKTISTQLGARNGPDLIVIPDTYFGKLAKAGLLETVDDAVPAGQKQALNATNDFGKYKGKQLAYTWETVNYALFWNKSLLKKAGVQPPKDFASLLAAAKAVKAEAGVPGLAVRSQMAEETPWWIDFSNWPYGFGGRWSKDGKLTIDAPENVQAVTAFKKMYDSGAMSTGDDASTFRTKFAQGKIGMMIDNSSALTTMVGGDENPVKSKDVEASPLPFPTPASANTGEWIGINKYSKHKALAKDFLKYLYSPDAQKALAAALGASSPGTGAPTPDAFTKANPWAPVYKKQTETSHNAVVEGFEDKTPQIAHIVLSHISEVLIKNADPATALKAAQAEASKLTGS